MNPIHFLSHDVMLPVLSFLFDIFHNYGLAIIFLTTGVKLILYPLTVKSTQQMKAMQTLQPKLKAVQEKHKGKPEQLQKETMNLYRENKVNPLGGCLPTLVQLPFFIALFLALKSQEFTTMVTESNGAFANAFLWIQDLSKPDPIYLLAILIGLSTYWTQKMVSMPGAAGGQKQMMAIMPFFVAFISVSFPSGVQLYWVVSNLLTGAQQAAALKH